MLRTLRLPMIDTFSSFVSLRRPDNHSAVAQTEMTSGQIRPELPDIFTVVTHYLIVQQIDQAIGNLTQTTAQSLDFLVRARDQAHRRLQIPR